MNIGCVVLASGESVRFGSNKLLTNFAGKPMLSYLLNILPASLQTIVVTRSEGVKALAEGMGFACLLHHEPEVRDTIRLGLEALQDTDACMFCVGDQPLLTRATIQRVIDLFEDHPDCMVRAAFEGREGNPAIFPPSLYGELCALEEGEAGVTVIRRHADRVRTVEAAFAEELADADTPETLQTLQTLKAFLNTQPKE